MIQKILQKMNFTYKFKIRFIDSKKINKIIYNDKWLIIDIRPGAEFKTSHIVLSKNLNMIRFKKNFHKFFDVKQKVLLVCRSGRQSHSMALFLQKRNYYNIYVLKNGYNNLLLQKHPFIID